MSFEVAVSFFIAIFVFAITPGPGVLVLLARALRSGAIACFPFVLGIVVSDIFYLIMATLGLTTIAENWGGLFTLIRLVGAAYLFYLGWKMWTACVNTNLQTETAVSTKSWLEGFIQGFLLSASNPKVILFYIAFLPTFMDLTTLSQTDIMLASVLTLLAILLGFMLIAFSAVSARKQFQSQRNMKRLNRTAGGIMMGAGVFLALRR